MSGKRQHAMTSQEVADNVTAAILAFHADLTKNPSLSLRGWYNNHCVTPSALSHPPTAFVIGLSTLHDNYHLFQSLDCDESAFRQRSCAGRPQTFSKKVEDETTAILHWLEETHGDLTDRIISYVATVVATGKLSDEERDDPALHEANREARLSNIGEKWLRNFKERNHFRTVTASRCLEQARERKLQPEVWLQWLRLVMHTYALYMIHREIVQGSLVAGWCIPPNGTVRRDGVDGDASPGDDVLEVVNGELWVKPLGKKLVAPPPERVICIDEVPADLDDGMKRVVQSALMARGSGGATAAGTSSNIAVVPVWNQLGEFVACQVLTAQKTTTMGVFNEFRENSCILQQVESAWQTPASFANFLKTIAIIMAASRENPVVAMFDGHWSHMGREVAAALQAHRIYGVVEPSQSSAKLQAPDLGPNRDVHEKYRVLYAGNVMMRKGMTVNDKLVMLLAAVKAVSQSCVVEGWEKSLLPAYSLGKTCHVTVDVFRRGAKYREDLPTVTADLLRQMFSVENVAKPWGTSIDVVIAERELSAKIKSRFEIADGIDAVSGELEDGKAGALRLLQYVLEGQSDKSSESRKMMLYGPKVYKAVQAMQRPPPSPEDSVSVSTEFGCALFDPKVIKRLEGIAKQKMAQEAELAKKMQQKQVELNRYKVIVDAMMAEKYVTSTDKLPTKEQCDQYAAAHYLGESGYPSQMNASRDEKLQWLLDAVDQPRPKRHCL